MDSHEKLGNLLSQYLSADKPESSVPNNVVDAFHKLGLTEFASRQNVDDTYREKKDAITREHGLTAGSTFAKEYAAQQINELDAAYKLISEWFAQS